jgi:hypothetical protein
VFSGVPSGSYLHATRPEGGDLRSLELPKTCSPEGFTRDGRVLTCFNLGDDSFEHGFIAFEREGSKWRRVPLPQATRFPDWVDWETAGETWGEQPAWAPDGKHIARVRDSDSATCCWFSLSGDVVVTDADGEHEQVVAEKGEAPAWSPDGTRLAFARCRISQADLSNEVAEDTAECSLWTVAADGSDEPSLLVDETASPPVWSPDGRFVAFLRASERCESLCLHQVFIVSADGGKPQPVGPELVEPSDGYGEWWPGLAWLPDKAPVIVPVTERRPDALELQRCVDIWNRARMHPWMTGAANVSLVGDLCQVTVRYYGGLCSEMPEMPFRYWCPSHGGPLRLEPPEYRVWNAHGSEGGPLILFEPPKGPRLPLPKAPPYPMLDGYVVPYGKDGEPLAGLKLTEATWTCRAWGDSEDDPLVYCSTYDECFKPPGRLEVGDVMLCPPRDWSWQEGYDPMRFVKVEVTDID